MASAIGITVNATAYVNSLSGLQRPKLDKAVALALVDTAKTTIVQAAKSIRQRTGLPAATVKERLLYDYVPIGAYRVNIKSSRKPIPLKDFPGTRQMAPGVRTRAWGSEKIVRSGFIVEKYGGNFFVRTSRRRFPIKKLWGPTIAGTFAVPEVQAVIRQAMTAKLQSALARRMAAQARRRN